MLKVDDQQLNRLLDAIKHPPPGVTSKLQNARLIVEILALIGAGVWALFIYLSVQKFTYYSDVMKAQLAVEQGKLDVARAQREAEQAKQNLESSIKFIDPVIEIRNLGSVSKNRFSYDVRYRYDFTVNSARKVTITVAAFEWFLGTLTAHDIQSFRANLPGQGGPISWKSIGIIVHYSKHIYATPAGELVEMSKKRHMVDTGRDVRVLSDSEDGGVGEWSPDEIIREFQTIHVVETPDKWVGFHVSFLMRNKDDNDLVENYDDRLVNLAAGTTTREEKQKFQENR